MINSSQNVDAHQIAIRGSASVGRHLRLCVIGQLLSLQHLSRPQQPQRQILLYPLLYPLPPTSAMSKLEKTIQRQQQKIAEGSFYEAHQQLRVIASRYIKQSNWDAATDILFSGAQSLLKAGQGGSGGDLCIFLLDVFNKGEVKPNANSKGKLLSLLRAFPKEEPTRKKFVNEMVAWSSKFGEYPAGDAEIHHVAGSLFAEGALDAITRRPRQD